MKNLRNFSASGKKEQDDKTKEVLRNMGIDGDAVDKYSAMNENELIESLISAVKRSKEDGSFSPKQMQAFISIVSPHLSSEQLKKLQSVISVISE